MASANPKETLCKYFASGACTRGDSCMYAHDWSKPSDNVCRYYLKGACAYGKGCRYDHVRPRQTPKTPVRDMPLPPTIKEKQAQAQARKTVEENKKAANDGGGLPSQQEADPGSFSYAGMLKTYLTIDELDSASSKLLLCPFAAAGVCRFGSKCAYLHGDVCPSCGKACLHPHMPATHEAHILQCVEERSRASERGVQVERSEGLECGICLDVVLDKPSIGERRFGVLPGCDHVFCLPCIRKWRNESSRDAVVRCCPLCRTLSYFVVPSTYWPATPEDKEQIMADYKSNLRKKPCKHFAYGEGTCPFGTSCFYLHCYPDGTLAETSLRKVADEDGTVRIHSTAKLWDFFELRQSLEDRNNC